MEGGTAIMYKVYACLPGQWTELTEDDYQIGYLENLFSPRNWINCTDIHNKQDFVEDSFRHIPTVHIHHKDKIYTISATLIQIVETK